MCVTFFYLLHTGYCVSFFLPKLPISATFRRRIRLDVLDRSRVNLQLSTLVNVNLDLILPKSLLKLVAAATNLPPYSCNRVVPHPGHETSTSPSYDEILLSCLWCYAEREVAVCSSSGKTTDSGCLKHYGRTLSR